MIVVDVNILSYLWLPSESTVLVERLLQADSDWVSPYLWRSEFRNVVTKFYRRKSIAYDDALSVLLQVEEWMEGREYTVNSIQVMEKVKASGCSAYDCEYLALAEVLACKLVTADKKIIHQFPESVIALNKFVV